MAPSLTGVAHLRLGDVLGRCGHGRARGRLAEHVRDDRLLAALLRDDRRDRAAVAEDRRAVAGLDHLVEPVRDEQHRAARSRGGAHHREHALGEVGGKRGRDLVEQQQLRVARERAREVDHPQHRQRHVADELPEVDVEVHRVQLAPHRARVGARSGAGWRRR